MSDRELGSVSVGTAERPKKKSARELRKEGRDQAKAAVAKKLEKVKQEARKKLAAAQENAADTVEQVEEAALTAQENVLKTALKKAPKPVNDVLAIRAANAERRKKAKNNFFGLTTAARNLYYRELEKKTHEANDKVGIKSVTYKVKGEERTDEVTLAIEVDEKHANGFCVSFTYRGKLYNVVPNQKIALLVKRVNPNGSDDVSKAQNVVKRVMRTTESFKKHALDLKIWLNVKDTSEIKGGSVKDELRQLRRDKIQAKHKFREASAKVRMASALRKVQQTTEKLNVSFPSNIKKTIRVKKTKTKGGKNDTTPVQYVTVTITKAQYNAAVKEATEAVGKAELSSLLTTAKKAKESVRQATLALKDAKLQYQLAKQTKRGMKRAARDARAAKRTAERDAERDAATKKPGKKKKKATVQVKQKAPVDKQESAKEQKAQEAQEAEAQEAQKLAKEAEAKTTKAGVKTKEAEAAQEEAKAAQEKAEAARKRQARMLKRLAGGRRNRR